MNKQNSNKLIKDIKPVSGSLFTCSFLSRYVGSRLARLVNSSPVQRDKLSVVKRFTLSKVMMVIAILTTLVATTVVAFSPIETLAQTRDLRADIIDFSTAGTLRMSIDNNIDNIGINTLPPEERLTVSEIARPTIDGNRLPGSPSQTTIREATTPERVLRDELPTRDFYQTPAEITRVVGGVRRTLFPFAVNSSGVNRVVITSSTGHGGTTNYRRIIAQDTAITLTAPATVAGVFFLSWTGCDSVSGTGNRTCNVRLNATRTVTVNYGLFHAFAAGGNHTLAIRANRVLWAWGLNEFGQLGLGDSLDRSSPAHVGAANNWRQVATSGWHTLAIRTDGTLWAWGRNIEGQLGNNNFNRKSPTQVGTATNWRQVFAGDNHTLAIKTDGTLWAWGSNNFGQLGLGDTFNRNSPTQVGTATNWGQLSARGSHTLAIRTDGTLWAWGRNDFNQLGLGDTLNRNSPTQVGTATNWRQVATGVFHTLAIRTDGTLWAWGRNADGQLGLGDTLNRNSITQVGTATNWRQVATSAWHTLATRTDGTLWAWGWNAYGQLGLGDAHISRNSPTQVGTTTIWGEVSVGTAHSLAMRTDGTLWIWGSNEFGQLGLGDTHINRNFPTQVRATAN